MTTVEAVSCKQAEVMAGRICAAAAVSAQSECQLLEMVGEFDAVGAVRWWRDVKSLAHWLSWCCSMSPGAAREHVRVARALRRMPIITAAFREGRLSYSKVREATRVVGMVDEQQLCELALTATASQLARAVSSYRSAAGTRIGQQPKRALSWTEREDGMVDFRARLPKEEAATLIAALTAANDQFGGPPPAPATGSASPPPDSTPAYGYADAILDLARTFLATAPEDRSGEDRTLVVVHVAADQLIDDHAAGADVPAGTSHAVRDDTACPSTSAGAAEAEVTSTTAAEEDDTAIVEEALRPDADPGPTPDSGMEAEAAGPETPAVPAGTPDRAVDPTCHLQDLGGIEPETARRLACDAEVIGAVVDTDGNVLDLGRTRRLVSRAQRRALMIRDQGMCQFPHCHQTRHLKAHHLLPWSQGGPTDLDNLILLCSWHHTVVHEGGMRIVRAAEPVPGRRWDAVMPDGSPYRDWYSPAGLASHLASQLGARRAEWDAIIEGVDRFDHPAAARIQPGWRGERFDLHETVQALFRMPVREAQDPSEEAA